MAPVAAVALPLVLCVVLSACSAGWSTHVTTLAAGSSGGQVVAAGADGGTGVGAGVGVAPIGGTRTGGPQRLTHPAVALVAPVPAAAMPADQPMSPAGSGAAPCARTVRDAGWLAQENDKPGTSLPATSPAARQPVSGNVSGYLSSTTVACGDSVHVYLSGAPRSVRLGAYRIGWYHGAGSRLVWQSPPIAVQSQPTPAATAATHLVEPHWTTSLTVQVTADWLPGVYLLVPQTDGVTPSSVEADGAGIPLIVRDDVGHEPLLFMASTLTWNAYNDWGGWSLYLGPGSTPAQRTADRARVVSLHRPLTGPGDEQLRFMDLSVVRWLESLGPDVAYTSDLAVDAQPSQLLQHGELVVGGHSEYWTTRMYDAAEAAVARGVNIAFLGANNLWWHARIEDGGDHEVVYRSATEDPLSRTDPQAASVLWSQWPLHRDAAAVTGQTHAAIGVHGGLELTHPPAWLTAGTTLHDGSLLPGSVGNEADGYNPIARHPTTLQVLAAGVLRGSRGPVLVTTNYATAPSGAAIFSAGSTDWSCTLQALCANGSTPDATAQAVRALTRNVVLAFAEPFAGLRHPAQSVLPSAAARFVTGLPAQALGTYGASESGEGGAIRVAASRAGSTGARLAKRLHLVVR